MTRGHSGEGSAASGGQPGRREGGGTGRVAGAPGGPSGGPERRPAGPCPGACPRWGPCRGAERARAAVSGTPPAAAGRGRRRTGHRRAAAPLRGARVTGRRPPRARTAREALPPLGRSADRGPERGAGPSWSPSLGPDSDGGCVQGSAAWGARASSAGPSPRSGPPCFSSSRLSQPLRC